MKVNLQAHRSYVRSRDNHINPRSPFITKNGFQYYRVSIDRDSENKAMDVCHELGHILMCRQDDVSKTDAISRVKREIMAWRIAKSLCLPEHWKESAALESIVSHFDYLDNWIDIYKRMKLEKLKITPLNQGITLR